MQILFRAKWRQRGNEDGGGKKETTAVGSGDRGLPGLVGETLRKKIGRSNLWRISFQSLRYTEKNSFNESGNNFI